MSSDLDALINGQRDLHGRMSRSIDNLKKMGASNITQSVVETRISLIDQLWAKFESQHELIRALFKTDFNTSEYVRSGFFDTAENTYVQQRGALLDYAQRLKPADSPPIATASQSNDLTLKTALPRITLKQFSGTYEEWPSFRDLFLSVVGRNSSISDVERFHYLRSCLQGPAEKLIRPLALTGDN